MSAVGLPTTSPALAAKRRRLRLDVTGRVQGVGFRPFVHRLATEEGLGGFVRNTTAGATLEVEGVAEAVSRFLARLDTDLRPPARIEGRRMQDDELRGQQSFTIRESDGGATGRVTILPDLVTCADCLAEVFDPSDRRALYPFTTCMHCGPRYSIVESIPYDRARTAMRHFEMCAACCAEYDDPTSRRFHAEANCCSQCGPKLTLRDASGEILETESAAFAAAATAIRAGQIVAMLGLGGFQLIADARNETALATLRRRKARPTKPFALLVRDLAAARALAQITSTEAAALTSPAGPIVLVRALPNTGLAPSLAPGSPLLGLMLPTTPLHHMLSRALGFPVVATSGNRGGEPIIASPDEAPVALAGIADLFLTHDRPIVRPIDDSVVRVIAGVVTPLRNARGLAPSSLPIQQAGTPGLALGGHQKDAIAVHLGDSVVLGPHIGDLDTRETRRAVECAATALPRLHRLTTGWVASDAHPDYYTTHLADKLGQRVVRVPHHLAHVLAGMADNALDGPVLGIAWDGTGYGGDGTIWGGEAIAVADGRWKRVAQLLPFPLTGGEAATRQPWRSAFGALFAIGGEAAITDNPLAATGLSENGSRTLITALERGLNAPLTSSAGRLFDAVAALLGLCSVASFEGEAAMALEYAADTAISAHNLPPVNTDQSESGRLLLDWRPTLAALARARAEGVAPEPLALGFHLALADAIAATARHAGITGVLLTGGCFQNAVLTELACERLAAAGFSVHLHSRIPPNDGGLAVGQAIYAAHPLHEERL